MNNQKYIIFHGICDMEVIAYIHILFGVDSELMLGGMKYLGYHIKPCSYKVNDWMYIVDHFYRKKYGWEFRCLSLGGSIILTQVMIMQLGAHWIAPRNIC